MSEKKMITTNQKFTDLGLCDSLLNVLKNLNLEIPTPIQAKAIPAALEGEDLIGIAQTGTGKTFAYGLPILQRLGQNKGQALVLAPTRELAQQVEESLKTIGHGIGLKTALLIGGESLDRQLFAIRKKPHIIVATPGRLLDHLKRRTLKLDEIKILVLDEADMMLDMGFAPQVEDILSKVPKDRQTMLFSATMPAAIVKLAARHMKSPVNIEVAPPGTTAELVDQEIYLIKNDERFKHLQDILKKNTGSVLVFVRTKRSVKEITSNLKLLGEKAAEIHSNLSLGGRRASLSGFKNGTFRVLVATDVAARGLDVNGIELVVNYNLPDNLEDYVHRIGRTGRAGKGGKAISLATASQQKEIRMIEKLINKKLPITSFGVQPEKNGESNYKSKGSEYSSKSKKFRPRGNNYQTKNNYAVHASSQVSNGRNFKSKNSNFTSKGSASETEKTNYSPKPKKNYFQPKAQKRNNNYGGRRNRQAETY